jgi:hypothetical protein
MALSAFGIVAAGCSGGSSASPTTVAPGPFASDARQVITDLSGSQFQAVFARFGPVLRHRLPLSELQTSWANYVTLLGTYRSQGTPAFVQGRIDGIEEVPVTMSHGVGEIEMAFTPTGLVAGLEFLPANELLPQKQP